MRATLAFILLGVLWTGEAAASSIIVLAPSEDAGSPSIITLEPSSSADVTTLLPPGGPNDPDVTIGEVEQPEQAAPNGNGIVSLSLSIIAIGEPDVAAQEKVAAIGGESKKPQHDRLPMVIRGGIVGDAFSPAAVVGEPAPVTNQPTASDQQASEAAPPQSQPQQPADEAPEPQAAVPPPASPTATTKVE